MKFLLRGTEKPVPENLELYLSDLQILGLCQAEEYGWQLEFVRRPAYQDVQSVMTNPLEHETAVLRHDGTVEITIELPLRH